MDSIADDAEIDAGPLVRLQQLFNGERRIPAPAPLFGQLRRIDMGVPINDHFSSSWSAKKLERIIVL